MTPRFGLGRLPDAFVGRFQFPLRKTLEDGEEEIGRIK